MAELQRLGTFHEFFQSNQDKRLLVVYGGAGSGKSVATAQEIVRLFLTHPNCRILVVRKTLPAMRITAYRLVLDLLYALGVKFYLNKSELVARFNNNEILFKGMDDPEKIKSYEANYVWVEEATEITKGDFLQLNLRMRRANAAGINQMFLTFNPIDAYHWLITDVVQGHRDDAAIHHSTYKDNIRFLSPEYISELENLINQDQNYYRIYALGEPGVLENVIYRNYEIVDEWPTNGDQYYGLDFGYNNPSALVHVLERDQQIYTQELLYKSGLTNADLISLLREVLPSGALIYADAAEPARIQEIRSAGFNIKPADKSVKDGIDAVKRHKLHIHRDSQNLIAEIRGYSYRTDKDGRVLEDPVKFRDHCMDSLRYAIHSHAKDQNLGGFRIGGATRSW